MARVEVRHPQRFGDTDEEYPPCFVGRCATTTIALPEVDDWLDRGSQQMVVWSALSSCIVRRRGIWMLIWEVPMATLINGSSTNVAQQQKQGRRRDRNDPVLGLGNDSMCRTDFGPPWRRRPTRTDARPQTEFRKHMHEKHGRYNRRNSS